MGIIGAVAAFRSLAKACIGKDQAGGAKGGKKKIGFTSVGDGLAKAVLARIRTRSPFFQAGCRGALIRGRARDMIRRMHWSHKLKGWIWKDGDGQ